MSPAEMDELVIDLFYAHLPRTAGEHKLADYGEWPLTPGDLTHRAGEAGFAVEHDELHPLVSLFTLRASE